MKSWETNLPTSRGRTPLGGMYFACENQNAKHSNSKRHLSEIPGPADVKVLLARSMTLGAEVRTAGTCMPLQSL